MICDFITTTLILPTDESASQLWETLVVSDTTVLYDLAGKFSRKHFSIVRSQIFVAGLL